MCLTGFISIQNLMAQVYSMIGGSRISFWDLLWTYPMGIQISFAYVAIFGAIFYTLVKVTMRYGILTRNQVIIILAGIVLFIFFSDYLETVDDGWPE